MEGLATRGFAFDPHREGPVRALFLGAVDGCTARPHTNSGRSPSSYATTKRLVTALSMSLQKSRTPFV